MTSSQPNYVESYWSGVVQRLQAEVQVMNRLVPHHGEQGRANELTLSRLLESLLPSNVSVGSGIIFDSAGRASGQTDLILYDASSQPRFLAQTTQFLFPVETVLAAIEVKTTLDDEELGKVATSKGRLRDLRSKDGRPPPPYYLMAYSAGLLPETMISKIRGLQLVDRPDYLCVLSTALLAGHTPADGQYFAGLAALHTLNERGDRLSGNWQEPGRDEQGRPQRFYIRGGMTYGVTALSQGNRKRLVSEPGRALLLFCERILSDLHERGPAGNLSLARTLPGSRTSCMSSAFRVVSRFPPPRTRPA